VLGCLCAAPPASAQVAASATLASDYRLRGHSLSDDRPALSLNLSYDHASGAYFGASAIGAAARPGPRVLGLLEYAGYARQLSPGLSAEAGLQVSTYTRTYTGDRSITYGEAFVGVSTKHFASRLYYSPDYFGGGAQTLYAEIDGTARPRPNWRLNGHVGALVRVRSDEDADLRRSEYDWRIGLARTFQALDVELAWTGAGSEAGYYARRTPKRQALVLAVTRVF
jgi:uncharacterized protein (TIGR02001 family)